MRSTGLNKQDEGLDKRLDELGQKIDYKLSKDTKLVVKENFFVKCIIELFTALFIGYFIGQYLDNYFDLFPIITVSLMLVCFIASIYNMRPR